MEEVLDQRHLKTLNPPRYAVLMKNGSQEDMWTVIFYEKWRDRKVSWECISDGEPWEITQKAFQTVSPSTFEVY